MKKVKTWVQKTAKKFNMTEQELSDYLTIKRSYNGNLADLEPPTWISYGSEWKDREIIGTLFYNEILDRKWADDNSLTDRYLVKN